MGRKTAVLLKGFRAAKCATLLKVATARIRVVRNKRSASAKQMRGEIAQLIKSGQDAHVYITKADALIKQENLVSVYDLLDQYCHAIIGRFTAIELHSTCPADVKEAIASIIYAAPKCTELTELPAIKEAFVAKYGKSFAAAATELRPECGVNIQIVEMLSTQPANGEKKLKLMKEICKEYSVDWAPGEALAASAATATFGAGVNEAGPSTSGPSQVTSKHAASTKVGLADAVMPAKAGNEVLFATDVPKPSGKKQNILPEEGAMKGQVPASVGSTPSAKDAVKTNVSIVEDATSITFEEEDARKLQARILQSLQGASFADPEPEAESNMQELLKSLDSQSGLGDSDSDSFVSVEDVSLDDDVERTSHGAISKKESLQEKSNQNLTEDDLRCPSVSKQEEQNSRTSNKNKGDVMELCQDMQEGTKSSSIDPENLPEEMSLKLTTEKMFEQDLGKEWRNNHLSMGKHVEARHDQRKEESMLFSEKDVFSSSSTIKSSSMEKVIDEKIRHDSMTKLGEAQSVKEMNENKRVNEKGAEEIFVGKNDLETLQKGETQEEALTEPQIKSSLEKQLSEQCSLSATKAGEGLGNESSLEIEKNKVDLPAEEESRLPAQRVKDQASFKEELGIEVYSADGKEPVLSAEDYAEEVSYNAKKVSSRLSASGVFKDQSKFEVFDDKVSSTDDEKPLPSSQNASETGVQPLASLTMEGISSGELVGAASSNILGTLQNSQDFAAAAKIIAEEAVRLAVERFADSKSIPLDAAERARIGVALKEIVEAHAKKTFPNEDRDECRDKNEVRHEGDKTKPETNVIIEEKNSKVETFSNLDDADKHDFLEVKEMKASNGNKELDSSGSFKVETVFNLDKAGKDDLFNVDEMGERIDNKAFQLAVAEDVMDSGIGDLNAATTLKPEPELENINPFAMSKTSDISRNANSPFLESDDTFQQRQSSQAAASEGHDDHLDIFFRRKMPLMSDDNLVFDETFLKPKPTFVREKIPRVRPDSRETGLHESLFSTPLFEISKEGQNAIFKDSFESSRHSALDRGDDSSFKSPLFDEVPELNDPACSFDTGLDRNSAGLSDRPLQSTWNGIKSSGSFDPEPESDEEELSMKESTEFLPKGQLNWLSKKPITSTEHEVTGTINSSFTSDHILDKPVSRRSRRQPKVYNDNEYDVDSTGQHTRSHLLPQHKSELGRKDADNVWPLVSNASVLSQQPSGPAKWATSKAEFSSSSAVNWDNYTGKKNSSIGNLLPSQGLENKQNLKSEDFYFPDKNDLPSSPASSSTSRLIDKSPPRHGYLGMKDDDVMVEKDGYKKRYNSPRIPKNDRHGMVEDEHYEEFGVNYRPSLHNSELIKPTLGGHGFDSIQQSPYLPQKPVMGSEYKNSGQDVGGVSRIRPLSRRQHNLDSEDEEPYLDLRLKPTVKIGELDYSQKPRISKLYQPEKGVDEDAEQMGNEYEHYRYVEGKSLRTRPMASKPHQTTGEEYRPAMRSTTRIQDPDSLDLQNRNKSKMSISKVEQEMKEDYEAGEIAQTETADSDRIVLPSSGFAWLHQPKQDALGSDYVQHEQGTSQGDKMPSKQVYNVQKWSNFAQEQDTALSHKEPVNGIKSPPSRPLSSKLQEKKAIEETDSTLSRNSSMAKGEDQKLPWSKQDKLTHFDGSDAALQSKRQNRGSEHKEQIQQSMQQPISGSLQNRMEKGSFYEDGEKRLFLSPSYKYEQTENKDFHLYDEPHEKRKEMRRPTPTLSNEGKEEEAEQVVKHAMSIGRRKQASRSEDNSSKADHLDLHQQFKGAAVIEDGQTYKKGGTEDEGKMHAKHEPLQLNEADDPLVLATIAPPVKKPSTHQSPTTVKLASSASDSSQNKSTEGHDPNLPKKAPTLQDLAANFEALRRARKGE